MEPIGDLEPLAGFGYALEDPKPGSLGGFEYALEEPNHGTLGDFEPFGYLEPLAGFGYILDETNLGSSSGFHPFGDLEPPIGFVSDEPRVHSVDANIGSLYPHSLMDAHCVMYSTSKLD